MVGGCGTTLGGPRQFFLRRGAFSIIHTGVNGEVTHPFMHARCAPESSIAPAPSGARWRGAQSHAAGGCAGNKEAVWNAWIGEAGGSACPIVSRPRIAFMNRESASHGRGKTRAKGPWGLALGL